MGGFNDGTQTWCFSLQPGPERSQIPEFGEGVQGKDLAAMDGERLGIYLRNLNPWESVGSPGLHLGSVGDAEILLSTPFFVTFDRLGRSGEVLHQQREGRATFKTRQKGAVRGSVPPWSQGNPGANPHGNVSGHKAEKKVTGSSQHRLAKLDQPDCFIG